MTMRMMIYCSLDKNVTTKSYSDQGHCIRSDLVSAVAQPFYSCHSSGGLHTSLSCEKIAPQGTKGYRYEQFYSLEGCAGNKTFAHGYYADYCYDVGGQYVKYSFTQCKRLCASDSVIEVTHY